MAATPESKVKKWLKTEVNTRYPDSWCYAPPGGPFGQIGVSDFMWVIKAGRFNVVLVIEVKSDEFMVPTVPQVRFLKKMIELNCVSALMRGKSQTRLSHIFKVVDERVAFFTDLSKKMDALTLETLSEYDIMIKVKDATEI